MKYKKQDTQIVSNYQLEVICVSCGKLIYTRHKIKDTICPKCGSVNFKRRPIQDIIYEFLIKNEDSKFTAAEIADGINVSRSQIYSAISHLRQKGLVKCDSKKGVKYSSRYYR